FSCADRSRDARGASSSTSGPGPSEGRLVRRHARRGPWVVRRSPAGRTARGPARATGRSALGGRSRRGPRVVVGRRGLAAALLTAVRRATLPLRARHLGGGVLQRGAD